MTTDFTPCPFCALQCSVAIRPSARGLRVVGNPADSISEGHLCRKGLASLEVLRHPGRVPYPLVRSRRSAALVPADWNTALDLVADRLQTVAQRWSPHHVAVYGSGALSNETAYLLGKFARVALKTREIDYNGRFCMSAAAKAYTTMLGLDRPTGTFEDIRQADLLLMVGSNLSEAHPMAMRAIQHAQANGATLIVVDPRRTRLAKSADFHLAIRPGTDGFLAWAMIHTVIRDNLTDQAFVQSRTVGYDDMAAQSRHYSPKTVSLITDIPAGMIESIARRFALSPRAVLIHGRGVEQYLHGVEAVAAFLNLVLVTGQIGRPGTGAFMLTGQANGQGGRELGQKSDQLPGSRPIADPAHRAAVARVWGIDPDQIPPPGRFTAAEFFPAIARGDIRALMVVGANPLLSAPDTEAVRRAMAQLDFLVVVDPILTETAELADVVLPAGGFGVTEGTITTIEARLTAVRPLAGDLAPQNARADWQVLQDLARRLGAGDFFPYRAPKDIFEELKLATEGAPSDYSGASWEQIHDDGMSPSWPIPRHRPQGTPRLYETAFAHPDGRARFSTHLPGAASRLPDPDHPLHLITGRVGSHYNSGAQTRKMAGLEKTATGTLYIHPDTAAGLAIRPGSQVQVANAQGAITLTARLTPDIRPDTVFAGMHNPIDNAVNHLISAGPLSLSGMPEFKHAAVTLIPLSPAAFGEEDRIPVSATL